MINRYRPRSTLSQHGRGSVAPLTGGGFSQLVFRAINSDVGLEEGREATLVANRVSSPIMSSKCSSNTGREESYQAYYHDYSSRSVAVVSPHLDRYPLKVPKNTSKKSKVKRMLSTPMIPTDQDVLAERGAASNNHKIAHDFYWTQIMDHRMEYLNLGKNTDYWTRSQKRLVALKVAQRIFSNGGRFLTREKRDWYEMKEEAYIEKIQTALREEKNIPESLREYAKNNHKKVYFRFCELQKRLKEDSPKRNLKKKAALRVMDSQTVIESIPTLKLNDTASGRGLWNELPSRQNIASLQPLWENLQEHGEISPDDRDYLEKMKDLPEDVPVEAPFSTIIELSPIPNLSETESCGLSKEFPSHPASQQAFSDTSQGNVELAPETFVPVDAHSTKPLVREETADDNGRLLHHDQGDHLQNEHETYTPISPCCGLDNFVVDMELIYATFLTWRESPGWMGCSF